MIKNKIPYFAICTLLMFFKSASADTPTGTDFLQQLNLKPAELIFQSCKEETQTPAVLLMSEYNVSGTNAKKVETYLIKHFGLKKLRFACCGWETSPVTYKSKNGGTYSINMYSLDEFKHQKTWDDYKVFRVRVGKYIILP